MKKLVALILEIVLAGAGQEQRFGQPAEEPETRAERLHSLAEDVVEVTFDVDEPSLFRGPKGRIWTSLQVLSVYKHESAFTHAVEAGLWRGDKGASWCGMQIHLGKGRTRPWNATDKRFARPADPPAVVLPGWTGPELSADRKKCLRAGLRYIRQSWGACGQGASSRLRAYASGSCSKGIKESADMIGTANYWRARVPKDWTDEGLRNEEASDVVAMR